MVWGLWDITGSDLQLRGSSEQNVFEIDDDGCAWSRAGYELELESGERKQRLFAKTKTKDTLCKCSSSKGYRSSTLRNYGWRRFRDHQRETTE